MKILSYIVLRIKESLSIYKNACIEKRKVDFEDLLQLQTAIDNKCTAFLTEDKGIRKLDVDIEVLSLDDLFD